MSSDNSRNGVVTKAEQLCFVEAVLAGKLLPDSTQIEYHFAGWLDKDVVDMVLEVSSDPSEAVSVLAGMSPTATNDNEASGTNGGVARFVGSVVPQSTSGASYGSAAAIGGAQGGNARQAKTLQAMRAQRSSAATAVSGLPNDEEKAREGGQGRRSDAELKKVAAFISSYAEEQGAAAKEPGTAKKPPGYLFFVPPGTVVPSTRKVQLVIANTAQKAVEVPGFEAFMKAPMHAPASHRLNFQFMRALVEQIQHGKDPLFRFLETDHPLHSYYLLAKHHVHEIISKGGKAKGSFTNATRKAPTSAPKARADDPEVQEIMRMLGGMDP